ncbi:MAG TPA: cytochrome c maturation protein CcmE [Micropepsaceae bacterium]|nr:cytochrome c maturation protein CcmE [Micropepsaceae bacterium]
MTPKKQRRLAFAITLLLAGGGAAALAVYALQDNILFFYSPSDIAAHPEKVPEGRAFRIGGLVEKGSVKRDRGLEVHFVVTDGKNAVPVDYSGVLPDLFREGQGVVAMGTRSSNGVFLAREVLAKHDEKYMPPEVVDALKRSGHWQEGQGGPGSS